MLTCRSDGIGWNLLRLGFWTHCPAWQWCSCSHGAPQAHINLPVGRPRGRDWRRRPGRPHTQWLDQIQRESSSSPVELWRRSICRGHAAGVTQRPSLATRQWWWWWGPTRQDLCVCVFTGGCISSVLCMYLELHSVMLTSWMELHCLRCRTLSGVQRYILSLSRIYTCSCLFSQTEIFLCIV